MPGQETLPPEEQTLLLDDYNSDDEAGGGTRDQEEEEEQDQGCLKVTQEIYTHTNIFHTLRYYVLLLKFS